MTFDQNEAKRRARAIPQKTSKSKEKCVYRLGFEFRRIRLPKGPLRNEHIWEFENRVNPKYVFTENPKEKQRFLHGNQAVTIDGK